MSWNLLSRHFATAIEIPGRALVDTAAQHGLIGQATLEKLDQHLMTTFGMRVKYTNEDGGTVRGVCGSEEPQSRTFSLGSAAVPDFSVCGLFLVQFLVCFPHTF